ncbi:hypothetical protein [Sodalis-like endosymbiont of Proechinophthirus fluctus]|uniref:hypothetical protein n=1 Tax=Sodalis-like endosymbiont of Proechinophthirus fluctus TaxID=1462730 RepID=UPI000A448D6B|nr:hypothetical protein [Sodalis-like endosymbiont of Proechinophthirus fluctus]
MHETNLFHFYFLNLALLLDNLFTRWISRLIFLYLEGAREGGGGGGGGGDKERTISSLPASPAEDR